MGRETEIELRPISEIASKADPSKTSDLATASGRLINPQLSGIPPVNTINHSYRAHVWKVTGVVTFYIITSVSMIMINKLVLRQSGLPLTFLWGQLVIAAVLLRLLAGVGLITLPRPTLNLLYSTFPLIGINVLGLVLNTLCLQNIDAVLYQIARSLILPITVALSPFLGHRISGSALICCLVISVGFVVGVFGEALLQGQLAKVNISILGVIFGVLSSFSTAIHSFIIKKSFTSVKQEGPFDLLYLNNLFSAILLAPFLLYEVRDLMVLASESSGSLRSFGMGTLLAGSMGLLINWAGFLQINLTSPITHTVSSAARGVVQTMAANIFLGEMITMARCFGIVVTLAGSCAYSLVKARENCQGKTSTYSKITPESNPAENERQPLSSSSS